MTPQNMKEQLQALQNSVDDIASEVQDVKAEQARSAQSHKRLHEEHGKLADRITAHEHRLELHVNDSNRQQEHNATIHAHMTGATMAVATELKDFRQEFREHDILLAEDRKEQVKALRQTVLWVVGTGAAVLLSILTLGIKLLPYFAN